MRRSGSVVRALVVVLAVGMSLVAGGVGAAATGHQATEGQVFAVQQGGACYTTTAIGDGSQTVKSFYNYSVESDYSSAGTTHLQENQVSNLFVYNGSEGYSLVFLHDAYGDAPYGSTVTFTVTGLADSGEWAVEDDAYDGRDDEFDHAGTRSEIDWMWQHNRTDGAAFRGVTADAETSITVDPQFNEAADEWDNWTWAGGDHRIEAWRLLGGDGRTVTTLSMSENVSVSPGPCDQPPSAALSATESTVATNESVTFDASTSTDDAEIVEYRWDFDGDGTVDRWTTAATATSSYESAGEYEATVTVMDDANHTDTASVTVTVTSDEADEPPTAALDAPADASVDDPVTLDASGSTDNEGIVEYRWDTDGDGTLDRTTNSATVETRYGEAGEYDATVTVADGSGNTATANSTVTVTADDGDTEPPTAALDAPADATTGESVTLDAGNSTDDAGIVEYRWDVDGDGSRDRTTSSATVHTTYEEPGEYEAAVTVADAAGNTDTATATVAVTATESPTAAIDAPAETETGTKVALNATGSTDDEGIVTYRWDFDGVGSYDQKTEAPVVKTPYETAGTYEPSVTVYDGDGQTDTATTTLTMRPADDDPPTATLDVPDEVTVDESFTVTATEVSDESDVARLRWFSDGTEDPDGTTMTLSFAETGEHTVAFRMTDAHGNERTITRTVTVVAADAGDRPDDAGGSDRTGGSSSGTSGSPRQASTASSQASSSTESGTAEFAVASVVPSDDTVAPGESVDVTTTVRNTGDAEGTHEMSVSVDGPDGVERTLERTVTVSPGGERTVTLSTTFNASGEYEVQVGNETFALTVDAVDTPTATEWASVSETESPTATATEVGTATPTETEQVATQHDVEKTDVSSPATSAGGPGFTALGALVAAVLGVLVGVRFR